MALPQTIPERANDGVRLTGHSQCSDPSGGQFRTLPECSDLVASALMDYLTKRFKANGFDFEQPPVELDGGWETYTYSFQLKSHPALPKSYRQPLILRIYSSADGLEPAHYEFEVEHWLAQVGFPVPAHLVLEKNCAYFGGPFLLGPKVEGPTLLRSMLGQPWLFPTYAARMAEVHARLHRLPTTGFPRGGDFLTRALEETTFVVSRFGLAELRSGLEWLCVWRPPAPRRPSVLHLDFHPLNLLHTANDNLAVIDWTEADIGDPHADVAQTLMSLECMSEDHPGWVERICVGAGRFLFTQCYLRAYRRQLALDDNVLSYYRALAAFRRLCLYGQWLGVGPTLHGRKPCAIHHLQPEHFRVIEGYFQKWSGVPIRLVPR